MQIKQARVLNVFWAPGETAEHRRIIKKYESTDPMKVFADLTHETRKLPIRD